MLLLGLFVGINVHRAVNDLGRAAERERTQVDAVLVADAPPWVQESAGPAVASRPARYTDAAGRQREVVLIIPGRPSTGTVVPVWVDRDGTMTARPPTPADAVVLGVVATLGIGAVGGVALRAVWIAVRREIDRRNAAGWARDWARVEPEWSGRGH
ncbi:MAG: uncharacterized protein K0R87_608 [Pseudonocardia sp.]|nr:uncharacterized protein [Pseudonocardia sp.]